MSVTTVNIQMEEDIAQIFTQASAEKRQKLGLLFSLWLREFGDLPLSSLMDEISDKAEQRGLTAETVESLLNNN